MQTKFSQHTNLQVNFGGSGTFKVASPTEALSGKDGASAYELAVKHGFEGTEEEWLASLKGEPGESATDYSLLGSKPSINGVTLEGDLSSKDLNLSIEWEEF